MLGAFAILVVSVLVLGTSALLFAVVQYSDQSDQEACFGDSGTKATQAQREYARSLGFELPAECSVEHASDRIDCWKQTHPTPRQIEHARRHGLELPAECGVEEASELIDAAIEARCQADPVYAKRRAVGIKARNTRVDKAMEAERAAAEAWEKKYEQELREADEWEKLGDDRVYVRMVYRRGEAIKGEVLLIQGAEVSKTGRITVVANNDRVRYDRDIEADCIDDGPERRIPASKIVEWWPIGPLDWDEVYRFRAEEEWVSSQALRLSS